MNGGAYIYARDVQHGISYGDGDMQRTRVDFTMSLWGEAQALVYSLPAIQHGSHDSVTQFVKALIASGIVDPLDVVRPRPLSWCERAYLTACRVYRRASPWIS